MRFISINDPAVLKRLFVSEYNTYDRDFEHDGFAFFLGGGLITELNAPAKEARRLLTPAFAHSRLAALVPFVREQGRLLCKKIEPYAGKEIDLEPEFLRLTFDTICYIAFGKSFETQRLPVASAKTNGPALDAFEFLLWYAFIAFFLPPIRWLCPWYEAKMRRSMAVLRTAIDTQIHQCRERENETKGAGEGTGANGEPRTDLLSHIMRSNAEAAADKRFSDAQIRDQILTFLFAGHDTTSNLLAWVIFYLAREPDKQELVLSELRHYYRPSTKGSNGAKGSDGADEN